MTGQQEPGTAWFRGLFSFLSKAVSLSLLPAVGPSLIASLHLTHCSASKMWGAGPTSTSQATKRSVQGVRLWVLPYPQTLKPPMSPHEEMAIRSQKSRGLGAEMRHGHQPGVQDQGVRHTKPESAGQSAFLQHFPRVKRSACKQCLDVDWMWALLGHSA